MRKKNDDTERVAPFHLNVRYPPMAVGFPSKVYDGGASLSVSFEAYVSLRLLNSLQDIAQNSPLVSKIAKYKKRIRNS